MAHNVVKILIVDDHTLFRAGLRLVLGRLGANNQLLEASDAEEGLATGLAHGSIDLILLDLHLPGLDGLACVRKFRQTFPDALLLILSGEEEPQLIEACLAEGARGFIHKSSTPEKMLEAIRHALDPEPAPMGSSRQAQLTPRQIEVLAGVCAGAPNKQIARTLGMSENTVRVHLHDIFRVLGVRTRTQAAMLARDRGLV